MGKPADQQETLIQDNRVEENSGGQLISENSERPSLQMMEAERACKVQEYIPPRRELLQQYEINIRF